MLINHGVDPDKPCEHDGLTPIFRACWGEYQHHTDTVKAVACLQCSLLGKARLHGRCCAMVQVNVLLHAGVEFDKPMGHPAKLPIQMAKRVETRELLIKAKERADPDVRNLLLHLHLPFGSGAYLAC